MLCADCLDLVTQFAFGMKSYQFNDQLTVCFHVQKCVPPSLMRICVPYRHGSWGYACNPMLRGNPFLPLHDMYFGELFQDILPFAMGFDRFRIRNAKTYLGIVKRHTWALREDSLKHWNTAWTKVLCRIRKEHFRWPESFRARTLAFELSSSGPLPWFVLVSPAFRRALSLGSASSLAWP